MSLKPKMNTNLHQHSVRTAE